MPRGRLAVRRVREGAAGDVGRRRKRRRESTPLPTLSDDFMVSVNNLLSFHAAGRPTKRRRRSSTAVSPPRTEALEVAESPSDCSGMGLSSAPSVSNPRYSPPQSTILAPTRRRLRSRPSMRDEQERRVPQKGTNSVKRVKTVVRRQTSVRRRREDMVDVIPCRGVTSDSDDANKTSLIQHNNTDEGSATPSHNEPIIVDVDGEDDDVDDNEKPPPSPLSPKSHPLVIEEAAPQPPPSIVWHTPPPPSPHPPSPPRRRSPRSKLRKDDSSPVDTQYVPPPPSPPPPPPHLPVENQLSIPVRVVQPPPIPHNLMCHVAPMSLLTTPSDHVHTTDLGKHQTRRAPIYTCTTPYRTCTVPTGKPGVSPKSATSSYVPLIDTVIDTVSTRSSSVGHLVNSQRAHPLDDVIANPLKVDTSGTGTNNHVTRDKRAGSDASEWQPELRTSSPARSRRKPSRSRRRSKSRSSSNSTSDRSPSRRAHRSRRWKRSRHRSRSRRCRTSTRKSRSKSRSRKRHSKLIPQVPHNGHGGGRFGRNRRPRPTPRRHPNEVTRQRGGPLGGGSNHTMRDHSSMTRTPLMRKQLFPRRYGERNHHHHQHHHQQQQQQRHPGLMSPPRNDNDHHTSSHTGVTDTVPPNTGTSVPPPTRSESPPQTTNDKQHDSMVVHLPSASKVTAEVQGEVNHVDQEQDDETPRHRRPNHPTLWDVTPKDVRALAATGSQSQLLAVGLPQYQKSDASRTLFMRGFPILQQQDSKTTRDFLNHLLHTKDITSTQDTDGPVTSVAISIDHGSTRGPFAFVVFCTEDEAVKALVLDGERVQGATVQVQRPKRYTPPRGIWSVEVTNIPPTFNEEQLHGLFTTCQVFPVHSIHVQRAHGTSTATVRFGSPKAAEHVCSVFNGFKLGDNVISVKPQLHGVTPQHSTQDGHLCSVLNAKIPLHVVLKLLRDDMVDQRTTATRRVVLMNLTPHIHTWDDDVICKLVVSIRDGLEDVGIKGIDRVHSVARQTGTHSMDDEDAELMASMEAEMRAAKDTQLTDEVRQRKHLEHQAERDVIKRRWAHLRHERPAEFMEGHGLIFIDFHSVVFAREAVRRLSGAMFDGRRVITAYVPHYTPT